MLLPPLRTFRENIAIKDVLFTGAPTAGTYTGYVNGYLNSLLPKWMIENPWLTFVITAFLFVVVLFIIYYFNYEARKKSLGEVLATGYFLNFSGKLTSMLKQQSEITFIRASGTQTIPIQQIRLDVMLPTSKSALEKVASDIEGTSEIAYLGNRSFSDPDLWVRITEDTSDGLFKIMDFPRTLFALPRYLSAEYTENTSRRIHKAFNEKFTQLVADNPDKRPPGGRFEIKQVN